jgi:hypothetical protein
MAELAIRGSPAFWGGRRRGPGSQRAGRAGEIRNRGRWREGLFQVWEVGDQAVDAGDREDAQDGSGTDDQQQLTTLGPGPLVRAHQDVKPGRIAILCLGHVDHQRHAPVRGCFEQGRPQPGGIGDIDLLGRRHDGHTADHLDREASLRHLCHLLWPESGYCRGPDPAGHYQDRGWAEICQ